MRSGTLCTRHPGSAVINSWLILFIPSPLCLCSHTHLRFHLSTRLVCTCKSDIVLRAMEKHWRPFKWDNDFFKIQVLKRLLHFIIWETDCRSTSQESQLRNISGVEVRDVVICTLGSLHEDRTVLGFRLCFAVRANRLMCEIWEVKICLIYNQKII